MKPSCRHCNAKPSCRPRGLCWTCFYTPAVRDLYPIKACEHNQRGSGNGMTAVILPPSPTATLVGTEDRLRIYQERAEKMFALNHPADNLTRSL